VPQGAKKKGLRGFLRRFFSQWNTLKQTNSQPYRISAGCFAKMSSDPDFGAESTPQEAVGDEKRQQSFLDSPSDGNKGQEKSVMESTDPVPPSYDDIEHNDDKDHVHADTAEELVTNVLHVDDDPSLSPWTVRTVFLGMSFFRVYNSYGKSNQ
jgi:hypothetical protein